MQSNDLVKYRSLDLNSMTMKTARRYVIRIAIDYSLSPPFSLTHFLLARRDLNLESLRDTWMKTLMR